MIENQQGDIGVQNTAQNVNPDIDNEKLLKQSDVNNLVGSAKQKGFEKGYQQAAAEMAQRQSTQQNVQQPPVNPTSDIETKIAQGVQKHLDKARQDAIDGERLHAANQMVARVIPKLEEAKGRYSDFDDVINKVDYANKAPSAVWLADAVDNSGDVLYDLAKNPIKLANIEALNKINPSLALSEVKKLSDSIKQNQVAASKPTPPEPLSRVKPSNIGVDGGGVKDAAYYRNLHKGKR